QERSSAAAVGKYPADIGVARSGSAEDQAGNSARGVGCPFDGPCADFVLEIQAAGRRIWMRVNHGFAAVQFVPDGCERRVPQPLVPVVCHEADAISLERV